MNLTYVGWHIPKAYEFALSSENWHNFEHFCFFATSLIFWWPIVQPWPARRRLNSWMIIPYLLTSDFVNTGLVSIPVFFRAVALPELWSCRTALRNRCVEGPDRSGGFHVGIWVFGISRSCHLPDYSILGERSTREREDGTGEGTCAGSVRLFEFVGKVGLFSLRVVVDSLRPPFEFAQLGRQLVEVGNKSLALIVVSGFALGAVMTLHTRSTLVMFGATAMIPAVQAVSFFVEIGPLVAGLLLAGRVGSGIGAVLANMRASEQIDAIESLSIDSFKFLVVPRVLACVIALPLLTLFMDFAGLLGGFLSEELSSHIGPTLYINRAFDYLQWSNFIAPTLKTAVFGFIIGSVSSYFGYTTDKGAQGVGEAATNSVVLSSLLIIVADVLLIKCIFFLFPDTAI